MTIVQIVINGLHKTIKPLSVFTKYQLPVIQSIRNISTAVEENYDEHFSLNLFLSFDISFFFLAKFYKINTNSNHFTKVKNLIEANDAVEMVHSFQLILCSMDLIVQSTIICYYSFKISVQFQQLLLLV